MLLCMLTLPWPKSIETIQAIVLPVMTIYPIGTVLLCTILLRQKEHNQAIADMMEAQQRYKSLFYNNHAAMLLIDSASGRIVDANSAASSFYGYSKKVLLNMNINQINCLSDEEIHQEMQYAKEHRKSHFQFRHRKASGDIIDVEVFSGPVLIQGKILLYSIIHDVTQRVISENALAESEQRFRLVVESAPDAIFIHTNQNFTYVNHAALKLFGAESEKQLLGTPILERIHPDFRKTNSGAYRQDLSRGGDRAASGRGLSEIGFNRNRC
jgi:PAS domain S-box-containing protein